MDGNPLLRLRARGQSVWLDGLHARLLAEGLLARLIESDGVEGVSVGAPAYLATLMRQVEYAAPPAGPRPDARDFYQAALARDAVRAADQLEGSFRSSGGSQGLLSVDSGLAAQPGTALESALRFHARLERPNLMLQIAPDVHGLALMERLLGAGVRVEACPVFSLAQLRAVLDAFSAGVREGARRGVRIHGLACIASVHVSPIDRLVDRALDEHAGQGRGEARALRGRAAQALAAQACELCAGLLATQPWQAHAPTVTAALRLAWAATSPADARYSDVKYVEELLAPSSITMLRLETMGAFREHGKLGQGLAAHREGAGRVVRELGKLGIDLDAVGEQLAGEAAQHRANEFTTLAHWLAQSGR